MRPAAPACLLVTGPPGVGKTTLIKTIFDTLRASHPNLRIRGFYTTEVRHNGDRIGFEVVTLDGKRGPLASSTCSSAESSKLPTVGKYKVNVDSFESLVLPELQVSRESDLFIVDEVGKMELYSAQFFPSVIGILDSNVPVLVTIPVAKGGRDIPGVARLRNDHRSLLFSMNVSNRDAVKNEVYTNLLKMLQLQ